MASGRLTRSQPENSSYPAHFYWVALKHAGIEPSTTVTWPALEVWRHLNAAVEAKEAAAKQSAANTQPSVHQTTPDRHTRSADVEDAT